MSNNSEYELSSNSYQLLNKNALEGFISMQNFASIEVYHEIDGFPALIISEIMKLLIPGGKFVIPNTEKNRLYLQNMNKEIFIRDFKVESSATSPLRKAFLRSKNEIKVRLDDDEGQNFLELLSTKVI